MARFNVKILDTIATFEKKWRCGWRAFQQKKPDLGDERLPDRSGRSCCSGLGQEEASYREDADALIHELNRENVAVYAVDARGLQVCPTYGDERTLQEISSRTGGTTFTNQNDLVEGMRLALEDSKISYTVGFSVPASATPGLHEISLRVTRPGVKLRNRESYELDDVAPATVHRTAGEGGLTVHDRLTPSRPPPLPPRPRRPPPPVLEVAYFPISGLEGVHVLRLSIASPVDPLCRPGCRLNSRRVLRDIVVADHVEEVPIEN